MSVFPPPDDAAAGVERQVPGPEHGGPRHGAAPQQRPQPGGQHDVGERLGQVVVGAQVEPVRLVVLAVLGRQDEDRDPVLLGPQPLAHLVAGQPGQHQVEDDRVVGALPGEMEPVVAVEGEIDREALGLQPALHRAREPPFVFHYQHPHGPSLAYGR